MIEIKVEGSVVSVQVKQALYSGARGVHTCVFDFDKSWDRFAKSAVFRVNEKVVTAVIDCDNLCILPWELLTRGNIGYDVSVGVYGVSSDEETLTSVWDSLGMIRDGSELGSDAREPSPDVYEQLVASVKKVDEKIVDYNNEVRHLTQRAETAANDAMLSAEEIAERAQRLEDTVAEALSNAPVIGDNDNWWLGGKDTGVYAKGVKGDDGIDGDKGDKGDKGDPGPSGVYVGSGDMPEGYNVQVDVSSIPSVLRVRDNEGNVVGIQAVKGDDGDSAYEVAVRNGFEGTEAEWLESLRGSASGDHEHTADEVGAASAAQHEVPHYRATNSLSDIGLDASTLGSGAEDLSTSLKLIYEAMAAKEQDSEYWLTLGNSQPLQKSIIAKINADLGTSVSASIVVRLIKRSYLLEVRVMLQSMIVHDKEYSCVFRYQTSAESLLTPFSVTRESGGFVSNSGGDISGGSLGLASGKVRMVNNGNGYLQLSHFSTAGDTSNSAHILLAHPKHSTQGGLDKIVRLACKKDGAEQYFPILHTGNKPSGTYVGTGNTAPQEINTGGLGNFIYIWAQSFGTILGPNGGVAWASSGTVNVVKPEAARFENGVLYIAAVGSPYNGATVNYTYQVL